MGKFQPVALAKKRLQQAKGDDGFTLVEMVVALTVVLLMAGAALLAAPGIITQSNKAACDAEAGSVANAIVASYAANGDYSKADTYAELITDQFLVGQAEHYTLTASTTPGLGVKVEFTGKCDTTDLRPITWGEAAQTAGEYQYGVST